jgi:selenocysteine lyase/cysteine desulfurase
LHYRRFYFRPISGDERRASVIAHPERYGVSTTARVSPHYFNTKTEIDEMDALIRAAITH